MLLFRSVSDNSEAQHSSISIYISLQRDDHSCWNFFVDLLSIIWFGAFQMQLYFGHLLFGFRFPGEIFVFTDLRVDQLIFDDHGSWSDLLDAVLVSWWIFSNNRRRPFRSRPLDLFELFKFFLIDPADSVYFCAFVLFWLEIRLITIVDLCFW